MLNRDSAKQPFQYSSIDDLKGKSVCITPLNGISMLLHYILTKSGVNVTCICDKEPTPGLLILLKRYHSTPESIEKYTNMIMQTNQVCSEYPDAVYIVADNRSEDFLKKALEDLGISQIVSAFQILEAEHEKYLTQEILFPDISYEITVRYIGYAQTELRLFLLRKQGRDMIGDIIISKNNGYMVSYMGEDHAADNLSALCALIFEAVTGNKDGYYNNRIKAAISKILPVFPRDENTDKCRLVSSVCLTFGDKWDLKEINKIMSLLISMNTSIGKIEIDTPNNDYSLLPEFNYIKSLYDKNIRAYANLYRPMFISQDYSPDYVPLILTNIAPYMYEYNENFPAIFIHVLKTAGTTLSNVFNIFPYALSAQGYRYYNKEKFDKLFKFAIVRNPWDWAVSCFHFLRKTRSHIREDHQDGGVNQKIWDIFENDDFKTFAKNFLREPNSPYFYTWTNSQSSWICDENGKILVDYVGRFEKLQESYEYICKRIGIDCKPLPTFNVTKHKPYQEYYDEETIEIVREIYKKDIELFGYEFEYLEK